MATVLSIDPGLAHSACAAIDTDGVAHTLRGLSVCVTSKCDAPRKPPLLRDDRVHRAREVRDWMRQCLKVYAPRAIVIEDFGFLQQAYSTACLAMAYQATIDSIDEYVAKMGILRAGEIPIVTASASKWRDELAPLTAKRQRTDTTGMTKAQMMLARKADRAYNARLTKEREQRAHAEAMRRVRGAGDELSLMPATRAVHALDAIGLFCWGITTNEVRARL